MEPAQIEWATDRQSLTVTELSRAIRGVLEETFGSLWISGEISGMKIAASGHCYFTLKDREAALKCVCFRGAMRLLRYKPQDGMAILARGKLDVYAQRGEYQLIVETIEPQGHGELQRAFEQLKKRLQDEGLFHEERKRKLPKLPQRIGIVTSPTGAVIQDILNILHRRHPGLHIRVYPVLVQGEGSIEQVCEGLQHFGDGSWAQVIIIARGGGSLEDLWTFNEELVARAIAASIPPVISAVGHETDFTIADFVADLRAPTPSAAAELVICTKQSLYDRIETAQRSFRQRMELRLNVSARRLQRQGIERATLNLNRLIGRHSQRVDDLECKLRDDFRRRMSRDSRRLQAALMRMQRLDIRLCISENRRRLEAAEVALRNSMRARLAASDAKLEPLASQLHQLSPTAILKRGYSLVETAEGRLVTHADQALKGSALRIRLAQGRVEAKVTASTPGDSSALPL